MSSPYQSPAIVTLKSHALPHLEESAGHDGGIQYLDVYIWRVHIEISNETTEIVDDVIFYNGRASCGRKCITTRDKMCYGRSRYRFQKYCDGNICKRHWNRTCKIRNTRLHIITAGTTVDVILKQTLAFRNFPAQKMQTVPKK